jgi:hypothetical protein
MHRSGGFRLTGIVVAMLAAGASVQAQPIELFANTVNMFRDTRGANDIQLAAGDRIQYGANVRGGSLGVSLGATYGPSGFTQAQSACSPLQISPSFCSRSTTFNAGRLEPWTLRFTRGAESLEVLGPSLAGAENPVPFPVSVSLTGSGVTPTVSWVVPGGFVPDGFRINVHDKNLLDNTGRPDQVHSANIAPNATSYTLPSVFSGGRPVEIGGNYTITLQLIETRDHVTFTNNNAEILRRSSSFFAFTPLGEGAPPNVALPTVDESGVYNFNVAEVGPSSITFIDPFVAVGYDYAVGAGDPNFASVLLPEAGDNQFTLQYTDAGGAQSVALAAGTQYFFAAGGVSNFRVSGIETSAMLDPADATAFITGLTFTAAGSFTGTMTPITEFVAEVPEPSTYGLMALGLFTLGLRARRRR